MPTIIISGDKSVGIRKPNLGIYKKMEERLEIYGSNLIMIGDSYENDVCGALNAGWKSIWIQPSNTIDTKIQKLSLMEFISKASSSSGAPLSISWECINK